MANKHIEIFQLKSIENTPYAFRGFMKHIFNPKDYNRVEGITYTYDVEVIDPDVLEDVFYDYNNGKYLANRDFKGHSMSVSDVVVVDGARAYYCDNFGWENITEYWFGGSNNA